MTSMPRLRQLNEKPRLRQRVKRGFCGGETVAMAGGGSVGGLVASVRRLPIVWGNAQDLCGLYRREKGDSARCKGFCSSPSE